MKYSFHFEAEIELNSYIDYYEECKIGLGLEFANEVYKTIQRIINFPNAWQILTDDLRRSLTNRFPFGVIYYIKNDEIIKIEKPSNFHIWDNKTNKWNYDKQLEIKTLNEELADLEGALLIKYDDLDKAITRKLKTLEKRLNTEIKELSVLIDEKYIKLEELEG